VKEGGGGDEDRTAEADERPESDSGVSTNCEKCTLKWSHLVIIFSNY